MSDPGILSPSALPPGTGERTFAQVLSAHLAEHPATLEQLSQQLGALGTPLSTATLSYWCTGRSIPARARSMQAVVHLERLLGLPPGQLVSALPGRLNATWSPGVGIDDLPEIQAAVGQWGLDLDRHLGVNVTTDHFRLGPERQTMRHECFQLQWAEDSVVERVPIGLQLPTPDAEPLDIQIDHGCRLGRSRVLPQLLLLELVFDQPLHRGDLRQLRYQVDWRTRTPITSYSRRVPLVMRYLGLAATFEGAPPSRVQHVYRRGAETPESAVQLPAGAHVQQCLNEAPVGLHLLQWQDAS